MTPVTFNVEKMFEPAKAFASLAISSTERMVALNTEMFTRYAGLAMGNAKEALAISDLDAATAYMKKQSEVANNVVESIVADAKVVAELGKEYTDNVQKMITEEVSKLSVAA